MKSSATITSLVLLAMLAVSVAAPADAPADGSPIDKNDWIETRTEETVETWTDSDGNVRTSRWSSTSTTEEQFEQIDSEFRTIFTQYQVQLRLYLDQQDYPGLITFLRRVCTSSVFNGE